MRQSSWTGSWKLNVPASNLPFSPPRSVVLDIAVDGDEVSFTEHSMDAGGREETVRIRARFDQQVYAVEGSALVDGFAIACIDERTWRTRGTRGGEEIFTATLMLAEDGASFREEAETTLADGTRAVARLVYERQ